MAKSPKQRGRKKNATVKKKGSSPPVSQLEAEDVISFEKPPSYHLSPTPTEKELEDNFRICTVLLMEDSPDLTELTSQLLKYIEAGLRPRFYAITPESVQDVISSKLSSSRGDDEIALAIKQRLEELKAKAVQENVNKEKIQEFVIDGKRSKDKINLSGTPKDLNVVAKSFLKHNSVDETLVRTRASGGGDANGRKKKHKSKNGSIDASSGSDNSAGSKSKSKKRKKGKRGTGDSSDNTTISLSENKVHSLKESSSSNPSVDPLLRKKTKKKGTKSTGSSESGSENKKTKKTGSKNKTKSNEERKIQKKPVLSPSLIFPSPRNSTMKKRGEMKLPGFELEDDSPRDGPDMFVLLHGFYDPKLLEALHKVAAPIDGILMLTQSKLEKKNLSVIDVEGIIPGAFMPQNVLPEYKEETFEAMDSNNSDNNAGGNLVHKFWFNLVQMINSADPSSYIHDVALFQSEIPKPLPQSDDRDEALAYYHAKLLDEIASRLYEMGLLTCWFQCYKSATSAKEVSSLSDTGSSLYEDFLSTIPAECVTVPLIMEALLMQVVEITDGPKYHLLSNSGGSFSNLRPRDFNHDIRDIQRSDRPPSLQSEPNEYLEDTEASFKSVHNVQDLYKLQEEYGEHDLEEFDGEGHHPPHHNFKTNSTRYRPYLSSLYYKENKLNLCTPPSSSTELSPKFQTTTLIDSNDFAGIRACHLENDFAVLIASNEVAGTFTSIRNYLWDDLPQFDEQLHAKFQANLTQFMHFLPWEEFDLNDMFFIIHLLLAAGTEKCILRDQDKEASAEGLHDDPYCCDGARNRFKSLLAIYNKKELQDNSLSADKNYLAMSEGKENSGFIISGTSKSTFHVIAPKSAKLDVHRKDQKRDPLSKQSLRTYQNEETEDEINYLLQPGVSEFPLPDSENRKSVRRLDHHVLSKPLITATKSMMETSPRQYGCTVPAGRISEPGNHHAITFGPINTKSYGAESSNEKWESTQPSFENADRTEDPETTLKHLLNCLELIGIQESGALEFPRYRQSTELCSGISAVPKSIDIIQQLQHWNHVEIMDPVQMVQALNQASATYLSMEKVYCPIYDTLLYIFHNPLPLSLTAQDSVLVKLKTLPGLQHFLDYTINEEDVMKFVMDCEKSKGLNPVHTLSVETLMRLIPEDQWLLIPSIKYTLKKRRQKAGEFTLETTEEEATADEYEEFNHAIPAPVPLIKPREKRRQRNRIDLGDGEPRPEDDGYESQTDYTSDNPDSTARKSNKKKKKNAKSQESSNSASTESEGSSKKGKKPKKSKKKPADKTSETDDSEVQNDSTSKKKKKQSKEKSTTKSTQKSKKSKRHTKTAMEQEPEPAIIKSLQEEPETPLPILTPQVGSDNDEDFQSRAGGSDHKHGLIEHLNKVKRFQVYDLGKRHIITTSDDFHLFPMDGSVISYNVSTIEPDYRMMQLKISKLGCTTVFYPYYFPHDAQLDSKSFVLVPHFHSVTSDGTILAFKDLRQVIPRSKQQSDQPNRYTKMEQSGEDYYDVLPFLDHSMPQVRQYAISDTFNVHDIIFTHESGASHPLSKLKDFETLNEISPATKSEEAQGEQEEEEHEIKTAEESTEAGHSDSEIINSSEKLRKKKRSSKDQKSEKKLKSKSKRKKSKSKSKPKKGKSKENEALEGGKSDEDSEKSKSKSKPKKGKSKENEALQGSKSNEDLEKSKSKRKQKGNKKTKKTIMSKGKKRETINSIPEEIENMQFEPTPLESSATEEEAIEVKDNIPEPLLLPPNVTDYGNWHYASSDETESEDIRPHYPSSTKFQFGWDKAVRQLTPLTHELKITLPSGLQIQVSDSPGPPLTREVKQTYISAGSHSVPDETSRYYTQNGTVIRFLTNGIVQTLNARGVTTNFSKISAEVPTNEMLEDVLDSYKKAKHAKVFKGDTILPTGEVWHISRGRRTKHDPLFVFTSETMPNGEVFRRRQDGTIFIHRSDGTCITNYPDGTRFTSRIVVEQHNTDPDLEGWEVIGMRYMIEHPNYVPVIFNNLSGNVHVRLPKGEWVRVFADGFIRVNLDQNYRLGIDGTEAILSSPAFEGFKEQIPNATAVKLYHKPIESVYSFLKISKVDIDVAPPAPPTDSSDATAQLRNNSTHTRFSHAGLRISVLMEKNLRMSDSITAKPSIIFTNGELLDAPEDDEVRLPAMAPSHANFIHTDIDGIHDAGENHDNHKSSCYLPRLDSQHFFQPIDLMHFLAFTDLWTICKSIDSYNNRFALDIFGNTVVDKQIDPKSHFVPSSTPYVDTKEPHYQGFRNADPDKPAVKPGGNFPGILDRTSTSCMLDRFRRMVASPVTISPPNDVNLPRIFALKRDLSGFEFLHNYKVSSMLETAVQHSASITADTQPSKTRKYITISEEISENLNPYGPWKQRYREPTFRPSAICNKDMKLASPLDLRWFTYILKNAHKNRGDYLPSPKDRYLRRKREEKEADAKSEKLQLQTERKELELVQGLVEEAEDATVPVEESLKLEEFPVEQPNEAPPKKSKKKGQKGAEGKVKGKKQKTGKAVKQVAVEIGNEGIETDSKNSGNQEISGEKPEKDKDSTEAPRSGRKAKNLSKTKKGKSKSKSKNKTKKKVEKEQLHPVIADEAIEEVLPVSKNEEQEAEVANVEEGTVPPREDSNQRPVSNIGNYPGDYPGDIPEVKGLYEAGNSSAKLVQPYLHSNRSIISPKAVIVRKLMEIPTLDPDLQKIITTASHLYAQSVKSITETRQQMMLPQDPRTNQEILDAEVVKKEFATLNLANLHTYEQDGGKSLDVSL